MRRNPWSPARGPFGLPTRIASAVALTGLTLIGMGLAAPPALAAVPVGEAAYGGYGSGAVEHLAVLSGDVALAQAAVSNTGVNSKGLTEQANELPQPVHPGTAGKNSTANGRALVASLLGEPIELVDTAMAEAAPSTDLVDVSLLKAPVNPVAYADVLNGQAQARWVANQCILGADIAYSRGRAANVELIGTANDPDGSIAAPIVAAQDPTSERAVVTSITRQRLVAQTDRTGKVVGGDFGLLTEVRQTVAPATVRLADGVTIAIEVAGTYTLRAYSGGLPGTSFVTFNPEVGAQAPLLTVTVPEDSPLFPALEPVTGPTGVLQVTLNELAPVTDAVAELLAAIGIAELKVAEAPRLIGDPSKPPIEAADGTNAAGALDIVRLRGIDALADTFDLRIGHAEATAFVPAGGIECPGVGVGKVTDKDPVVTGDTFTYTITVTNPYDCVLTNVKLVDTVSADRGIEFTLGDTTPKADDVTGNQITWNDIGPIGPKANKSVTAVVSVTSARSAGKIKDTAVATADCAVGDATGKVDVKVSLTGSVTLLAPSVQTGDLARGVLPATGSDDRNRLAVGAGLAVSALALVELNRRRRSGI